ncbi:MAG TPA: FxSxx-COOH system tetratricopeptide repeat protein [Candidatus Tectomicrobia bacterium]|nr:FxSxx-COOH system tetratricopeptide repeat protein [Candidatus Tectomicrobia bacterium]
MATFDQREQIVGMQLNADDIAIYAQATTRPVHHDTLAAAEQQLAALPLETIPNPAPLPDGSRLPFCRNPLFVGRRADLRYLAQVLKGNRIAAIGQIAAATGLGGLGKTQLAVEFAHRYGPYFAGGVFWLTFANPDTIPHEIAACVGTDGMQLHADFSALPLEDQVHLVQRAWQNPLPRLLVFDNCEDQELIAKWRPTSGGCRVLITSRRVSWEASLGIATLVLDVLPRVESITLLRQFRDDLAPSDPNLDGIAAELGDLPLALHLAGSFLARYRQAVTPAAYLAQLRRPDLLVHPSLQGWKLTQELSPTRHEQHVARTFALSYDRLDPIDPTDAHALALLARAAYFAPGQPIPRRLLLATMAWAGDTPDPALQGEDSLQRLLELGLLESDATGAVRLHRLLAAFVGAVAHDTAAQAAVEIMLIFEAYRVHSAGHIGPVLTLQPHLQAVTEAARLREDARAACLETMLGDCLRLLGDYAGAQPAYERALALHEQLSGPDHPNVARSLYDLANLYRDRERYREAESLHQRALATQERGLGPDHPDVARTLHSLAFLYWYQRRYAEAELLYQRVMATRERVLGPDHRNVAMTLNNLALVYRAQGRYREAESLHQRALAIRERVLGTDHPDVTMSLHNLANLYQTQGRYREAEPLYQRALATRERVLGPDHPRVALSLNHLADFYLERGRYPEAEPLYQRALTIWERVLNPDHPNVFVTRNRLILIYWTQGRYAEAEPLFQRTLAFNEQGLGPTHSYMAVRRMVFAFRQAVRRQGASFMPLRQRIRVLIAIMHMAYTALNQYMSRRAAPSMGAMMRMAYAGVRHRIRAWLSGPRAAR